MLQKIIVIKVWPDKIKMNMILPFDFCVCVCVFVLQSNCLPILFRFVVIDLSAGPCTYGKIETEEGSVSPRTLPRLRHVVFPRGFGTASAHPTHEFFIGQLASLISTTVEHVIAPDVRYLFYILMQRVEPLFFCNFTIFCV